MEKKLSTKDIVLTGLGIAVVFVATMFIKIPNALDGYFNLGDGFILIFASILDPFLSFLDSSFLGSSFLGSSAFFAVVFLVVVFFIPSGTMKYEIISNNAFDYEYSVRGEGRNIKNNE